MNKLNQKGFAHILLILFFILIVSGLAAGLYLVQKTQIFKPKAADIKTQVNQQESVKEVKPDPAIESLTDELLQLDKQYDQIQPAPVTSPSKGSNVKGEQTSAEAQAKLNSMVEVAKKREDLLVKKTEQDPQGFLQDANLADKIDTFPEPVKEHIERKIQGNGTLEVVHSHDFSNQKSKDDYFIDLDDKDPKKYNVHFSKQNNDLSANAKVSINSIAISDDTVATNVQNESSAGNPIGTIQILSAPNVQAAAPGLKVAVVLVRYADDTPQFSDSQVKRSIDHNIKPYYKEISKGDDLNVDVLGFYEIPTVPTTCDFDEIKRQVDPLVGSRLSQYHKTVYVLPIPISGTGNSCLERSGQLGGRGSLAGFDAVIYLGNPILNLRISNSDANKEWDARFSYVFLHEFFHTFGIHHANFLTCARESIKRDFNDCNSFEYGDPSSIMGSWLGVGLNSLNLWIFGSKYKSEEYTPNKKIYKIAPLEKSNSSYPQILIVGRFSISYRQPIGRLYDSVPSEPNLVRNLNNFFSGASIHTGPILRRDSKSFLLRSNPEDPYVTQAPMRDGDVVRDGFANLKIKQISHDENSVTLEVSDYYARIFVTNEAFDGDLKTAGSRVSLGEAINGLDGADKLCQNAANKSTLYPDLKLSSWKAWLSTKSQFTDGNIPKTRILDKQVTSYYPLPPSTSRLDPPSWLSTFYSEVGSKDSVDRYSVWLATDTQGSIEGDTCSDWTSNINSRGESVIVDQKTGLGMISFNRVRESDCSKKNHLYCVEMPGIPPPTVSLPASPTTGSVYTTHYRYTDDLTVLQGTVAEVDARLPWKEYTSDPVVVNHTFSSILGAKAVWVEFKDSTGTVERRTLTFNLTSPTISPSPSPSATSTPIPTITPTSVPTTQPTPAATATPVPTPVVPPVNPGGGTGGGGGGGGGGGSAPVAKRTIYYIRIGEDPYKAGLAERVRYYPGEPIRHEFKEDPRDGKYFIYIKFFDVNDQLFKINGKDYITQSIDFSEKSNTTNQPAGGVTNPQPIQPSTPQTTNEEVVIGTASLSTEQSVAIGSPVSITLSLSGFSSPGRSIVGLFVRNETGTCSINDCGYDGWTQIRSYGSNGTDTSPYTDTANLSPGKHMFAVFSLNADGTAGQLLAVDDTNFGGSSENNSNPSQCQPKVTECGCGSRGRENEDPGKCYPECNGGWCEGNASSSLGGICASCQP